MNDWWYEDGGGRSGPVTQDELRALLAQGRVGPETAVWTRSMARWGPIGAQKEFASVRVNGRKAGSALSPEARASFEAASAASAASAAATVARAASAAGAGGAPAGSGAAAHGYGNRDGHGDRHGYSQGHGRAGEPAPEDIDDEREPAGAWPRWAARQFDMFWESMLVGAIVFMTVGRSSPAFLEFIANSGGMMVFGLLCIPVGLVLDAALLATFGHTPGKALLGLHVRRVDGGAIGFAQHLGRNLRMWLAGYGLGFFVFPLLGMARQHRRLRDGKEASYDGERYRVDATPVSAGSKTVFWVLYAGVVVLSISLQWQQSERDLQTVEPEAGQTFSWTNPQTRRSVDLASDWTYGLVTAPGGMRLYRFSQHSDHAVVALSAEQIGATSLSEHAQALDAMLAPGWRMSRGYLETYRGVPSWVAQGEQKGGPLRMRFRLVKIDGTVWGLTTVQAPPLEYTDELADELEERLWDTIVPESSGDPSASSAESSGEEGYDITAT